MLRDKRTCDFFKHFPQFRIILMLLKIFHKENKTTKLKVIVEQQSEISKSLLNCNNLRTFHPCARSFPFEEQATPLLLH